MSDTGAVFLVRRDGVVSYEVEYRRQGNQDKYSYRYNLAVNPVTFSYF